MNIFNHLDEIEPSSEAEALRGVVEDLRSAPELDPSQLLAWRIMDSVDRESSLSESGFERDPLFKPWFGAAVAAAVVAVLFAVRYIYAPQNEGRVCAAVTQEQWLAECQERDGSWNPARHGGSKEYQPALTALSALALHRSGDGFRDSVNQARIYFERIQGADGSFGGNGREALYNQAIATFFLAETATEKGEPSAVLKKAVAAIQSKQSVVGGWDYVEGSEGSAAITSWQIQALAAAGRSGVADGNVSMRRGLRWLRDLAGSGERVAYNKNSSRCSDTISALAGHTLLTAGAAFPGLSEAGLRAVASMHGVDEQETGGADLYRDCMKVRALRAAGKAQGAAELKNRVAISGNDIAADQWGKVGGRLYMASMRSLAGSY